ncbi:hypothetical protein NLJ89_g9439 [Agrocybe chaxingu]|uniref:Uncharacterized protein n=1 Tax=Agrocybe chaxingu TaxID=84603 RepID=A0A9W8JTA1_9AGAR|nr:hypothetical protein NLJ89_g9439 [Agrocybe chaxingu]
MIAVMFVPVSQADGSCSCSPCKCGAKEVAPCACLPILITVDLYVAARAALPSLRHPVAEVLVAVVPRALASLANASAEDVQQHDN